MNYITEKELEVRQRNSICTNQSEKIIPWYFDLKYVLVGTLFGLVLIKSEVINWFRIQEMFRFQSFHMYGIIGSAVVVGMISVFVIKKFNIKTLQGEAVVFHTKVFHKGNIYGGLIFGLGWAMTGACPGPLFAQLGSGVWIVLATIVSAITGTWVYGRFREKLPH